MSKTLYMYVFLKFYIKLLRAYNCTINRSNLHGNGLPGALACIHVIALNSLYQKLGRQKLRGPQELHSMHMLNRVCA